MFDTFNAEDYTQLRLRDPNDTNFPELFRYLNKLDYGEMTFVSDKQLKSRYESVSQGQSSIRTYAIQAGYSISLRTGVNANHNRRGTFITKLPLDSE